MVQVQDAPAPSDTMTVTGTSQGGGGALDWWDVSALLAVLASRLRARYRTYSATSTRLPSRSRK
jgi:hypothetical protein